MKGPIGVGTTREVHAEGENRGSGRGEHLHGGKGERPNAQKKPKGQIVTMQS